MTRFVFLFVLLSLALSAPSVFAQDDASYDERVVWAEKMHDIKPTEDIVNAVIDTLMVRVPEGSQETFRQQMLAEFDITAIEKASMDAMVETFTLDELKVMYEYTASPEGQAIQEKMPVYQTLVEPAISAALDKALLGMKFGE